MNKGAVLAVQQRIVLVFSRHCIVRKPQGYLMIVEYVCPRGEYLYELVMSPAIRYYSLHSERL